MVAVAVAVGPRSAVVVAGAVAAVAAVAVLAAIINSYREFDISIAPSFVENKNWNNRKSRYYKRASESGRKTFSLSWKFLPNFMDKTVDTRHGRDYIASISEDPDVHVLKVINQDQNGLTPYTETSYNVFVRS